VIKVRMQDGAEHEIEKFVLYDYIGLEKQFGIPVKDVSETGMLTHLAFLSWHALEKRMKAFTGGFEVFCSQVEQIESPDEDDEEEEPGGPPSDADQPTG
jgi:hypothetical protein